MTEKSKTITLEKATIWKVGFFILLAILVISYLGSSPTGEVAKNPTPSKNKVAPNVPSAIKISPDPSDPIYGEEDAEITIFEFSDFQCPFCARAFSGSVAKLKESNYIKSGEVNFVYRHLPLNSIHQYAQKAAEASVCAQDQGMFWEYHDELFANQQALDTASLKSYATRIGLDKTKFDSCLDNGEATRKVANDLKSATEAGGRGTPYFVVLNKDNGKTAAVSGAVPFEQLEQAIRAVQ